MMTVNELTDIISRDQNAGIIHADEIPVSGMDVSDLDVDYFSAFFEKNFAETIQRKEDELSATLKNMNLLSEGKPNLAAALLFSKIPTMSQDFFLKSRYCSFLSGSK